jgi:hypothetical protein
MLSWSVRLMIVWSRLKFCLVEDVHRRIARQSVNSVSIVVSILKRCKSEIVVLVVSATPVATGTLVEVDRAVGAES